MLTIVTGTPGAGKSLFTLWKLKKDYRDGIPQDDQRPIYVNGVPELDYEFFNADELVDPEKWYELPEGSIIFIDEAQRVFPQRPPSIPVPDKCRQFETHRHKGYDVIVTTQDATTLDVHIRKLAGRHFHIKRALGQEISTVLEYDHYQKDPTDHFNKKEAISSAPWKYPKALYDRYKSATLHTVKKRYPLKLFLIPAAIIAVILLGWKAVTTIGGEMTEVNQAVSGDASISSSPGQSDITAPAASPANYLRQFKEITPGVQHTSPFYMQKYQASDFPKPYCVTYQSAVDAPLNDSCKCLTQQGTTYVTPEEMCRYWVENGFFDPTKESEAGRQRGERPSA